MKIYVASSWRNKQLSGVIAELRGAGQEVYDFREDVRGAAFNFKAEAGMNREILEAIQDQQWIRAARLMTRESPVLHGDVAGLLKLAYTQGVIDTLHRQLDVIDKQLGKKP